MHCFIARFLKVNSCQLSHIISGTSISMLPWINQSLNLELAKFVIKFNLIMQCQETLKHTACEIIKKTINWIYIFLKLSTSYNLIYLKALKYFEHMNERLKYIYAMKKGMIWNELYENILDKQLNLKTKICSYVIM